MDWFFLEGSNGEQFDNPQKYVFNIVEDTESNEDKWKKIYQIIN